MRLIFGPKGNERRTKRSKYGDPKASSRGSAKARRSQLSAALCWRHLRCPTRLQRLVRLAGLDEDCRIAGSGLIATYDHIDVERIEFDPAADAAGPKCPP